jgi:hypothetical protein
VEKICELYNRKCIDCGDCEVCDLDSSKKCDNCGKCIEEIEDYRTLNLEEFLETHISNDEIFKKKKKEN